MNFAALPRLVAHLVRGVEGDDDTRRRATLLGWFVVVLELQIVVFAAAYWILDIPVLTVMLAGVAVVLLSVPWMARRMSLWLAVDWMMVQLFVVLDAIAVYTGGDHAPAYAWTVAGPVLATLAGGRRRGLLWLGVMCVNAVVASVVFGIGWLPPEILTGWADSGLHVLGVMMLGTLVLLAALIYEHLRDEMHRHLDVVNRDLRLLLDSVGQGFFTAGRDGLPSLQRSAILGQWFGAPADRPFWRWLAPDDLAWSENVRVSWEAAFEGVLPLELLVEQLPRSLRGPGRAFDLTYHPILAADGRLERLSVVVDDVQRRVVADQAERIQSERAALMVRMVHDRRGFLLFWDEVGDLLGRLRDGSPAPLRDLHTLKGTSAHWGLRSLAEACHELEQRLLEEERPPTAAELTALTEAWTTLTKLAADVVGHERDRLELDPADLAALEGALARGASHGELSALVASWRHERTEITLGRLADQARSLADRLGKGPLEVEIAHHDVRLDPQRWRPVWSAMVHAIRNALDHGIEDAAERALRSKPAVARLQLVTRVDAGAILVEIVDDGRGIDWDRVRSKAAARGLAHDTHADLQRALLSDGFSTRDEVTLLSGRGVGLAALTAAAHTVGGAITIESRPNQGTRVRVRVAPHESVGLRRARYTG